jgi:hypothetical protein
MLASAWLLRQALLIALLWQIQKDYFFAYGLCCSRLPFFTRFFSKEDAHALPSSHLSLAAMAAVAARFVDLIGLNNKPVFQGALSKRNNVQKSPDETDRIGSREKERDEPYHASAQRKETHMCPSYAEKQMSTNKFLEGHKRQNQPAKTYVHI